MKTKRQLLSLLVMLMALSPTLTYAAKDSWTVKGLKYEEVDDANGSWKWEYGYNNTTCWELAVVGADGSYKDAVMYFDIGSTYAYVAKTIKNVSGIRSLSFADFSETGRECAYKWLDVTISDNAFGSSFEALYMKYQMYAGLNHTVMLRPDDVRPAGNNMFANCPNAKIYVDAEYYDEFINSPYWKAYADRIVPTASMRAADSKLGNVYGANYARDNNRDYNGSFQTTKSSNGTTVYKVHVIGPDDSYINNHDGKLYIYKDVGETYAYTTTKIWASAFEGDTNIKEVLIYDIMPSATKNYLPLNIAIGDKAFKGCTNLKVFNVVMNSVDGSDHYETIHPSQLPIGKGVFDDCPNLKIRIPASVMSEFIADKGWSQYKDKFEPYDFAMNDQEYDGVKYSYFRSEDGQTYYCNKDSAQMEAIVGPWAAYYRGLKPSDLLCPELDKNVWYLSVSGVNDATLNGNEGVMNIRNDIGITYNYKTIAINGSALQGNQSIRKIIFTDCHGDATGTWTRLKMVIPNNCFKGCSNLKELNMFYHVTDGTNHYETLSPSDIYVGEHAFDDVHPDFRIVVAPDLYDDFITDPNWSQYKDKIVASDYLPVEYGAWTVEGLTYDYAAKTINTLPTDQVMRMQASAWNALIIGVQVAIMVATWGQSSHANAGIAALQSSAAQAIVDMENTHFMLQVALTELANEVTSEVSSEAIASVAAQWAESIAFYGGNIWTAEASAAAYSYAAAQAASAISPFIIGGIVNGATALGSQVIGHLSNYLGNQVLRNYNRPTSWRLDGGQWLMLMMRDNIYHMYISKVADDVKNARIYNDIGKTYYYRTVAMAKDAFRNKKNLESIEFADVYSGKSLQPMILALPDSAFYGCDNLRTVNLIMQNNQTSRKVALTPDNFMLSGKDLFAGCDTTKLKIIVGEDVLQDFLEDSYWAKYKNLFVTEKIEVPTDWTVWSSDYTYAFQNNTLQKITQKNGNVYHLNIKSGNNDELKKNDGLAALLCDIGETYAYKLDYVLPDAFKGNDLLKRVDIQDCYAHGGDVHYDFSVTLCDSAFANCKNLRDFNLLYQITDGTNKTQAISPDSIRLGKGVFDGCDNLRLKIPYDMERAFLNDTTWAKYKDKFVPAFFEPKDSKIYNIFYDKSYAHTSPLSSDWWEHIDATKIKDPADVKDLFRGKDFTSFDEFYALSSCGLKTVYEGMFEGCAEMQSIALPKTTEVIETKAFKDCKNLYQLVIPDSIKSIKEGAFTGSGIKKIAFTKSEPIDIDAKAVFGALPSDYIIYVPDSLVGSYKQKWAAVADHINSLNTVRTLKEVHMKEAGTLDKELGLVFDYDNLKITGNYSQYDSLRIYGPINGKDIGLLRHMGGRNVNDCEVDPAGRLRYLDLYEANIKKSDHIYNYWGANDYVQEDNSVDTYMFCYLDQLQTLILPKTAKKIKKYSAYKCSNLRTLVVGENVENIEKFVTYETPLQVLVMLGDKVPDTHEKAWRSDVGNIRAVITKNRMHDAFNGSVAYYTRTDTVTTNFKDDIVFDAMKAKHVFSPVDLAVLQDMEGYVNDSTEVKTFDELMYAGVKRLGDKSLSGMSSLEEVALPIGVKEITQKAFSGCKSLETIWALNDSVPQLAADAFADLPYNFIIKVNEGMEDKFREAWPQYADHIQGWRQKNVEVTEVTLKEPNTLADSLGFTIVMEPDDARYIHSINGDFSKIQGLKINGPIGGKDIALIRMLGGRDFDWNQRVATARMSYLDLYNADIRKDENPIYYTLKGKNQYVYDNDVVPQWMLWNLDNLETVILPKSVKSIDYAALYDMLYLKKVVVGDNTTYIGNDAFGDCPELKTIVFLCNDKPELHHDAFTDPVEGARYQVDNFYVPKTLVDKYTADYQYTDHAKNINVKYDDDEVFRAYGRNVIATDDDLQNVTSVKGWFEQFKGIRNLSSLGKSAIDTLNASDLKDLADLRRISLPRSLQKVEQNAFAGNGKLAWADFTACDSTDVITEANIGDMGFNKNTVVYVPVKYGSSDKDNVVYGAEGSLKCEHLNLTESRDYDVPKAFTAGSVSFDRLFAKRTAPYSLCLPFDCDVPEGTRAYTLSGKSDNMLIFTQVTEIEAEKPYIIIANEDAKVEQGGSVAIPVTPTRLPQVNSVGYSMLGTLTEIGNEDAAGQKAYVLQTDGQWHPVAADGKSSILPFRCFIQANGTRATRAISSWLEESLDNGETILKTIDSDGTERIYDLNGRMINESSVKGVYIKNGKKYVK